MEVNYTILATRLTIAKAKFGIPFLIPDGSATNLHSRWEIWKDDFTLYTTASGITQDSQKLALFLQMERSR